MSISDILVPWTEVFFLKWEQIDEEQFLNLCSRETYLNTVLFLVPGRSEATFQISGEQNKCFVLELNFLACDKTSKRLVFIVVSLAMKWVREEAFGRIWKLQQLRKLLDVDGSSEEML